MARIKYSYTKGSVAIKGIKVRPCPFCGDTDEISITPRKSYNKMYKENGTATISLMCERCKTEMYEHDFDDFDYVAKVRILVEKWNTRKEKKDGAEKDHE